jgi:hypothetical protein
MGVGQLPAKETQMRIARFAFSMALVLLMAACLSAQNVVVQWNGIASTTIVTNAKEASVASGVWLAYVHLAVYDAVNAIDHRFQPYLFTTKGRTSMPQPSPPVTESWSTTFQRSKPLWIRSSQRLLRESPIPGPISPQAWR